MHLHDEGPCAEAVDELAKVHLPHRLRSTAGRQRALSWAVRILLKLTAGLQCYLLLLQ